MTRFVLPTRRGRLPNDAVSLTPEHLHLALNHIPFLGAGFALIPLLFGLFLRNRSTVIAGLVIAVVSGWVTPLVMESGESAYKRYKKGPVAAYLDPQAKEYLEVHEHRAEDWAKILYANAVITTLGLIALLWKPRWIRRTALLASLSCLAALLAGIWIAESGGLIRRPDFRATDAAVVGETSQGHSEDD